MIKFFRKLRRKVLAEGKFSRYLVYAIGEIALVVVGILIALWINNLNEGIREAQIETNFLEGFRNDLIADGITLREIIGHNEERMANSDSIIALLTHREQLGGMELTRFYHWNLSLAFESYFIPEKSTIRQFEANSNGNLITSRELKNKLFRYYSTCDRVEANVEKSIQLYQHNFLTREIIQNILSGEITSILMGADLGRPAFDLDALKQNSAYIFALSTKKIATNNQNEVYYQLLHDVEELVRLTEEALDQ
ncbi:DUF6090 family protein [Lewinella sp. W8]|uniref:DUF6090 family protein n=1 Tax=Lewinella sp. W8 TaxID=2528208 RepID=UPI0010685CEA|nr:DUF6090 family protein [Lewinella sp. W8]MTB51127.1 hypothetical protein [Lewinella sp. W8]